MEKSHLTKALGVSLLGVFCLPLVAQAQTRGLIKAACKEAGCPLISAAELAGKVEKAVAEASKSAKVGAEVAKPIVTGSIKKPVVTISKSSEEIKRTMGTESRSSMAPAANKPLSSNQTKYYSMANNAEEIPMLTQKVAPVAKQTDPTYRLLELYKKDDPKLEDIYWETTDLDIPEIAAELDAMMARHPEILKNPEYASEYEYSRHIMFETDADYTADQIAMVAAMENKPQWIVFAHRRSGHTGNAMYYALKNGHFQLADEIIKMTSKSQDALYEALVLGDEEMAELIFKRYNVDLEQVNFLDNPLIVRMAAKSAKGVEWLLDHGASLYQRGIYTVVSAAASNGQVEVLDMLAKKGVDMNEGFKNSHVFFHPNSVQKLIELGAKVNREILYRAENLLEFQRGDEEKFRAVNKSIEIIKGAR